MTFDIGQRVRLPDSKGWGIVLGVTQTFGETTVATDAGTFRAYELRPLAEAPDVDPTNIDEILEWLEKPEPVATGDTLVSKPCSCDCDWCTTQFLVQRNIQMHRLESPACRCATTACPCVVAEGWVVVEHVHRASLP